jgi:hypothetical protein
MLTGPPGAPLLSAIYRFLEVSLGIIVSLPVTRIDIAKAYLFER